MDPSSPIPENEANLSALGCEPLHTGGSNPSSPWVPPTAEELHKLLPEYEIVKMLGRGGMGAVYMGKQISLDRPVAIKILSSTLEDSDMGFKERFKNEAKAMGKLSHPGIVAVYDFGETEGGLLYIVMEYIEGTDVAKMIAKEGRLPTDHAMAITAHVCDALGYAHERGIIHRDIKPANIMVGYDGVVKVADFGLAKMTQGQNTGLTQSGMAMGTLHYMAPEALILGSAVDHRADIYAVGVMLYQMLTGKIPQGMFELPSLQVPGLDPRYDGIIAKALREDRVQRYQAVGEMRRDLDGILTQPVVKMEEKAEHTPAALPSHARPQRPAGQGYRPPSSVPNRPPPSVKSSSGWLVWSALGLLALGGSYVWLSRTGETSRSVTVPSDESGTDLPTHPLSTAMKDGPTVNSTPLGSADGKVKETKPEEPLMTGGSDSQPKPPINLGTALRAAEPDKPTPASKAAVAVPAETKPSAAMPLANLPELTRRLEAYLKLRRTRVETLANQYLSGLDLRLNKAAADGNLSLVNSFKAEKERVVALLESLAHPDSDPMKSVAKVTTLPSLEVDAPEGLVALRTTWTGERQKIRDDLDQKLEQSLKVLESEFTKNRELVAANAILIWRESLGLRKEATGVTTSITQSKPSPKVVHLIRELETATKQAPFVNSLGMKFVPVKNTEVLFCIHEVRNKDYAEYAKEVPKVDKRWQESFAWEPVITDRVEDHPAVDVDWHSAKAFCEWLSLREGKRYRLPTDQEWSYAVGIGNKEHRSVDTTPDSIPVIEGEFPWGTAWPPPTGVANLGFDDGYPTTAPVMTFRPNALGLYDMGGNAAEWCEDFYNHDEITKVTRGGHWRGVISTYKQSSSRGHTKPNIIGSGGIHIIGFRVVVEISGGNVPKAPAAAKPPKPADPISKPVSAPSTAPAPASEVAVPALIPPELKAKVDGLVIAVKEKQWEDAVATSKEIREQIAPLPASIQLKVLELMTGDVSRSLSSQGKQLEETFAIREAFLTVSKSVRGLDHEQTGYAMLGMADSMRAAGRHSESLALRESALAIAEGRSAEGLMFYVKQSLAVSYFQAGRFEEALILREEALPLARKVRGPEDVMTTDLLLKLSESYEKAERYDEAISSAEEVVSIRTKTLGLDKAATRTSIEHLIRLYEAAGKQDEADKMRKNLSPSDSPKP